MAVAEEDGVEFETVLYLKNKPDRATLERLVEIIEDPVEDLVRKDSRFKKLELEPEAFVGNKGAVVDILATQAALLQRPVIVKGDRAIIGRPRDRVRPFLTS